MIVVRVVAVVLGLLGVLGVLASAVRTVVVPRGESTWLAKGVLVSVSAAFGLMARSNRPYEVRDRWLARQAPTGLVMLPFVWSTAVVLSFWPVYWALGSDGWDGLVLSASSLTTLGFARGGTVPEDLFSAFEALMGLGLVALMISFLPTIYGRFAQREQPMARLALLAGAPPDPAQLLIRTFDAQALDELDEMWREWERWFADLREAHTSFIALNFFRSQDPHTHWLTAAGVALDSAALAMAALEPVDRHGGLMMRTGFDTLRQIADQFDIVYDPDPAPTDPISVPTEYFQAILDQLDEAGLPLRDDRAQIWRDWAGWRVNYDSVLIDLAKLTHAPPARLLRDNYRAPDAEPTPT